jgi:RHS repeat-associated protein
VPHAFGSGFPTADAGPGQVALWTGEFSLSESDADLPSSNSSISVTRTHNSFAGDTPASQKVFGPGWVAGFDGGDGDDDSAGLSTAQVYDSTAEDGTIALVTADGDTLVYTAGARRTGAPLKSGVYKAADDDTATSGITAKVSADTKPILILTDEDGTITRFTASAAPAVGTATTFTATDVTDPATPGAVTYQRDTAGRVTAIIAPLPVGVTGCVPGTRTAGCRLLRVSYNGDGLVSQVSAQVDAGADKVLSSYTYNADRTMASQTDVVTGLVTKYAWTGKDSDKTLRLASITPPGQDAYQLSYASNRLAKVTRALPSSVAASDRTAQIAAFVYNAGTGVSDFNLAQFDDYQLPRTASHVFAVFGPDQKINAAPAAGSAAWRRADVYLTDDEGYTIHQGSYGAGAWQLTASVYDDHSNVIQSWDGRATQMLREQQLSDVDAASTTTEYNPDWSNAAGTVVTPAGSLPLKVTGPARWATDAAGARVWTRPVTTTVYDLGDHAKINPATSQPYRLVTASTVSTLTQGASGWAIHDVVSSTLTGYDLATSDGSKTGWDLGQPTSVTTDMDTSGTVTSGDITRQTIYDAQGRTVEERQPSAAGKSADPGTRITRYYAAGNDVASCRKTEWIGLVCSTGPGSGTATPTESTTEYTWDQQAATTVKASGGAAVTTTTSFDAKMRPVTVTTTASGLAGSTPVPAVTTSYDAVGQVTGTTSTAGDTATGYDTWGRKVSYTNHPAGQSADTATTTYDAVGQVSSVADNTGSSSYVYDGTDANGQVETRGLVTKVTQTSGGQSWSATAAYDGQGQVVTEKLPGGVTRTHSYDPAGEPTGLTYLGAGTDPGTGAAVDGQVWFGWTSISDAVGRTTGEWSVDGGSAYQAATATRADQRFSYDNAARLTRVDDATLTAGGAQVSSCQRRGYGFDANGNRTSQSVATNPACASTGASTTTRGFDAADRPTSAPGGGAYVYDAMGRQTAIPAADTAHPSAGAMSLGYFDDDSAYSVSQGATAVSYVLDGAGRRSVQATSTNGAVSASLIRHYTDDSDNPSWMVTRAGGTETTTRYAGLTGDGLGLTFTTAAGKTTAQLQLAGPRGDINATVGLVAGQKAAGIDSWAGYTEYGIPEAGTASTQSSTSGLTDAGYGWLGKFERSSLESLGITLMGARLYNQTTGLFTSTDPIYGGNTTAYGYPADPINQTDLDGFKHKKKRSNHRNGNRVRPTPSRAEEEAWEKKRHGKPLTPEEKKLAKQYERKQVTSEKTRGRNGNKARGSGGRYQRVRVDHAVRRRIGWFTVIVIVVVIVVVFVPGAGAFAGLAALA